MYNTGSVLRHQHRTDSCRRRIRPNRLPFQLL